MIHDEHPFATGPSDREPTRRFRGRLASAVTIVTSANGSNRAGLTVSSLFVVEGQPGRILFLVGPTTDLWDVVAATGRLVVHVCRAGHRAIADVFAGLRPNPGGVFAGVEVEVSEWGPLLVDLPDRAFCTLEEMTELGYSGVVTATMDKVETSDLTDPLLYFRGGYRSLD